MDKKQPEPEPEPKPSSSSNPNTKVAEPTKKSQNIKDGYLADDEKPHMCNRLIDPFEHHWVTFSEILDGTNQPDPKDKKDKGKKKK